MAAGRGSSPRGPSCRGFRQWASRRRSWMDARHQSRDTEMYPSKKGAAKALIVDTSVGKMRRLGGGEDEEWGDEVDEEGAGEEGGRWERYGGGRVGKSPLSLTCRVQTTACGRRSEPWRRPRIKAAR